MSSQAKTIATRQIDKDFVCLPLQLTNIQESQSLFQNISGVDQELNALDATNKAAVKSNPNVHKEIVNIRKKIAVMRAKKIAALATPRSVSVKHVDKVREENEREKELHKRALEKRRNPVAPPLRIKQLATPRYFITMYLLFNVID